MAKYFYSAKQNTPQLAAWVLSMWQNLTQRGKFRNAPSACGGDRSFQGFASLLNKLEGYLYESNSGLRFGFW
jgi:hypothetical protein